MSRRSGNPAKRAATAASAGPKMRRCHYCGAKTASPLDQSQATETARYPHAPFAVTWAPVCSLRTPLVPAEDVDEEGRVL